MSEEKIFRLQYWGRQHGKTNAQVRDIADRLIEFFKGSEIKAEISAKSVDYDQLLADARELQKALGKYASREFWSYGGFNKYGNQTAIEALETFTKKYGSAE